jgi:subtilisin family serine protease
LELIGLRGLMCDGIGRPEIRIGVIDGPVALGHTELAGSRIELLEEGGSCRGDGAACAHGTFVTGILGARRGSAAAAICPGCTLLIRPMFADRSGATHAGRVPEATPDELAAAIHECLQAGARLINISAALLRPALHPEPALTEGLNAAMRQGALIVAAAGNQGSIGATAITGHPWAIPVTACDQWGWPATYANLGRSIGRRGVRAPGEGVTSLAPTGATAIIGGSSVAAPLVTGAIALLWSEFPAATAAGIRLALGRAHRQRGLAPPLFNAEQARRALAGIMGAS